MIGRARKPRNTRKKVKKVKKPESIGKKAKKLVRKRVKKQIVIPWKALRLGFIVLFLMIVVTQGRQWLYHPDNIVIKNYELKGKLQFIDREALDEIVQPLLTNNMLAVDLTVIAEALQQQPWIEKATVYRRWPSELVIEVIEQTPIAFWGEDRLVNHRGEIFEASLPSMVGKMPMLYDSKNTGNMMDIIEQYKHIREVLLPTKLGITRFVISDRGAWEIQLTNDWVIEIGKNHQQKRLQRLVVAYNKELRNKTNEISSIDLRYSNGLAVRWK